MAFDVGNVSYRVYDLDTCPSASDFVAMLAEHVAPPIDTLTTAGLSGWVSPRFILDREVTDENCISAGYVHAQLMKAELKIPNSLLKAYCRIEEIAEMQARGVPYLNRQTKADIKKQITDELLPKMPPALTSIPMVLDTAHNRIYVEALSEKQQDAYCVNLNKTTRLSPILLSPEISAMRLAQVDVSDIPAQNYSPDPAVMEAANNIGLDFLTWLWFHWETNGGTFTLPSEPTSAFSFMLEGPITFFHEGSGAHEAALRKGTPIMSREAKTALESGKKLSKAKFTLARGDEVYSATLDGSDFSIRQLKLPKEEMKTDPVTAFQERMAGVIRFTDSIYHLYHEFLLRIGDGPTWVGIVEEMKEWIKNRETVI